MAKDKKLYYITCPCCGRTILRITSTPYVEQKCTCGKKVISWVENGCVITHEASQPEAVEMMEKLQDLYESVKVDNKN